MRTYLYRLTFEGPVHFGTTGIGLEETEERVRSDSLTSALINAFSVLGRAEHVVETLTRELPAFTLSSLFPYGPRDGGKVPVYALPRPIAAPPTKRPDDLRTFGKELKRLRYLGVDDFLSWIGDDPLCVEELEGIITRSAALARSGSDEERDRWWVSELRLCVEELEGIITRSAALARSGSDEERDRWWVSELRPRVALDRENAASSIWLCGVLHFAEGAGLYGLVRFADEAWRAPVEEAFRLLGELGLGGERTYGMGGFTFSGLEAPGPDWRRLLEATTKRRALLSLYYPADGEQERIPDAFDAWDVVERRGYIVSGRDATTLKRKKLRMMTEGSVLGAPVRGCLADVTPDSADELGLAHRVYRSGLAFLVPKGDMA